MLPVVRMLPGVRVCFGLVVCVTLILASTSISITGFAGNATSPSSHEISITTVSMPAFQQEGSAAPPTSSSEPQSEQEEKPAPAPALPQATKKNAKEVGPLVSPFDSLERGLERSEELDRPVLVLFSATWCGPCKELHSELTQLEAAETQSPRSTDLFRNWILVQLDVDEHATLADRWEVRGVPAMRIVDLREKVLASSEGYQSMDDLREWLARYAKSSSPKYRQLLEEKSEIQPEQLGNLVDLLGDRSVDVRDLAISRMTLASSKESAAVRTAVWNILEQGSLAQRISALEILKRWQVDVPKDSLDPWQPETFRKEALAPIRMQLVPDSP